MSREADEKQAGTGDIGAASGSGPVGPATSEALKAIEVEHQMTLRDTFRFWPKAIFFSFVLSLAVIMEGYDTNLMSNFYPFPAFKNHYGDQNDPDGGRLISARWQTSISNATQAGSILGLLLNGWLSERIGYKKTMIGSMGFLIGAIFIPFFSTGLPMFVASGIVQGIPWGIFQTLAVTYAADVCPTALRAYMTSWINMCWVIGILISNGVLKGLLQIDSQWGYRIPFAVQWVWPIPIIIGTIFAPESPWWLVRKGRLDDAKAALRDLTSPKPGIEFDIDAQVELMRLTNEYEKELSTGAHYWDCFRGVDRRRTEIACLVWITQSLCGVPFMSYGIQFMQQAGLNASAAYSLNLGQSGLGLIGCILAWFIMTYVGRRTMYVGGLAFIFVILMIIGFLGIPKQTGGISWAVGGLIIFMLFGFQLSLGPACYSIVSEIPSTRLRIKTVALSRASYNIAGFVTNALMPPMVGKNDWNWGPKAAYFWAGIDFAFLTWTFFRLPEPKDLTYTELDLLFEHGVSARKFTREAADALKFELGDVASRQEKVAVQHEE